MYAIVAITEMYGPSTKKQVVAFSNRKAAADQHAASLEAASTSQYGCKMLDHNQASGTDYVVRRVDTSRCARGYACSPMYLGTYVPDESEFANRQIVEAR